MRPEPIKASMRRRSILGSGIIPSAAIQSTSSLVSLLQWNPLSINLLAQVLANRLETLAFAHKIEFEAEANAEHSSRNAGASSYRRYLIHTGKARMIEVIPCFRQKGQLTWVARTQYCRRQFRTFQRTSGKKHSAASASLCAKTEALYNRERVRIKRREKGQPYARPLGAATT
jgi:hypothetical protein